MPLYHYVAINGKGERFRGDAEAFDKPHLIQELNAQGFFLESWRRLKDPSFLAQLKNFCLLFAATAFGSLHIGSYSAQPMPEDAMPNRRRLAALYHWVTQPPQAYIIVLVCLFTIFTSHLRSSGSGNGLSRPVVEKIQSIHPGMKRSQVEKFLHPSGRGAPSRNVTRYLELPDTRIDISYVPSQEGHFDDRVIGITEVVKDGQ